MIKFCKFFNRIWPVGKFYLLFFVPVCLIGGLNAFAQVTVAPVPNPTATPKPKTAPTPKIVIPPKVKFPQVIVVGPTPKPFPKTPEIARNESDLPAEKSITVEPKVNISLCINSGAVKINGWDRDEVRALVREGSEVGFKVAEKNPKTEKPVWIFVLGFDPKKNTGERLDECLSGEEIEIDVPRGATLNLRSVQSDLTIKSVAKVRLRNDSGNINLSEIENGIEAVAYEGDIAVENSSGRMTLETTLGNILAFDVRPSDFGDIFKAKTHSGAINLIAIEHRQVETGTISGATNFKSPLNRGGQYSFGTQSGAVILMLPTDSICKVNVWYGFGAFRSEFLLQQPVKKPQSESGRIGQGEAACTIFLKTSTGSLRIKDEGKK